jgi:general secretion pathway protein G
MPYIIGLKLWKGFEENKSSPKISEAEISEEELAIMRKVVSKRKGFTLVELLIVIVIIGILAGGMMLASGAATSTAKATMIISNLRTLSAAAMMYYADNINAGNAAGGIDQIKKFMGDSSKVTSADDGTYGFEIDNNGWWVSITGVKDASVSERLVSRAAEIGLYGAKSATPSIANTGNNFYMKVR